MFYLTPRFTNKKLKMHLASSPIEKVCVQLLLREPFYGHFLMGIPKAFDTTTPTAAVALFQRQMVKLIVNPDFWQTLSEAHQYGLIKHEVLHIVLRHLTVIKSYTNRQIFNIAADLVVNQYIEPQQLPEGAITLQFFRPLETTHRFFLEAQKGVGYYYEKLLQLLQNRRPGSSGDAASDAVFRTLEEWLRRDQEAMLKHRFWDEFSSLDSSEMRVLEQFVKNATRQALQRSRHKNRGNLPGHLLEELEAAVADAPLVNWRRLLQLFAASSNSTFLKSTIRRPSKRYGTVPGIRLNRRHELVLALDTSGSVSMEELALFFNEIRHIWRQGAHITVLECDKDIHRTYPYKGIAPEVIAGRGGTHFDAPITWANVQKPDALIYFTDGYAPAPTVAARIPVLWVITSQGADKFDHLPGKHIKLLLE